MSKKSVMVSPLQGPSGWVLLGESEHQGIVGNTRGDRSVDSREGLGFRLVTAEITDARTKLLTPVTAVTEQGQLIRAGEVDPRRKGAGRAGPRSPRAGRCRLAQPAHQGRSGTRESPFGPGLTARTWWSWISLRSKLSLEAAM